MFTQYSSPTRHSPAAYEGAGRRGCAWNTDVLKAVGEKLPNKREHEIITKTKSNTGKRTASSIVAVVATTTTTSTTNTIDTNETDQQKIIYNINVSDYHYLK